MTDIQVRENAALDADEDRHVKLNIPPLTRQTLFYRLVIVFSLCFFPPAIAFLFFGIRYDLLSDQTMPYFIVGGVFCALIGFVMLRRIFDRVNRIENAFCRSRVLNPQADSAPKQTPSQNALRQIELSLREVENRFQEIQDHLIHSSFRGAERIHAVLSDLQKQIGFDLAILYTADPQFPETLAIKDFWVNGTSDLQVGLRHSIVGSTMEKILRQTSPVLIKQIQHLKGDVEQRIFTGHKCSACLMAPIHIGGGEKGLLVMGASDLAVLQDARKIIGWITNGLSLSIERARLFAYVDQRDHELEALRQIGRALASSTFDMNKVLSYTMDMIRGIIDAEAGSLLLLKGNHLEFAVSFDTPVAQLRSMKLRLGQGIAGTVASTGQSILDNDVASSPNFFNEIDKKLGFTSQSILCVPMISKGGVIGVLEVINKKDGAFTTKDKDILQSIAASVSIAIENARLYKKTLAMAKRERTIRQMFQKFVPKEVVEQISSRPVKKYQQIDEIRTLTLINVDIRGFTDLSKSLGPQRTVALLNRFFSEMGDIVFRNQGIVDKYLGDGFLAIFGAPVTTTRDADNAIRAALEMQEAMPALNIHLRAEMNIELTIGISMHTGEVVVGNIGFDRKMDYTVIGDSVNTLFRLQSLTRPFPNGIVLGERTCHASSHALRTAELKDKQAFDSPVFLLNGYRDPDRVLNEETIIHGPPPHANMVFSLV